MEVLPIRQLVRWAAAIGGALSVAGLALLMVGPTLGLPGWHSTPPSDRGAAVELPAVLARPASSLGLGLGGRTLGALPASAAAATPVLAVAPRVTAPVAPRSAIGPAAPGVVVNRPAAQPSPAPAPVAATPTPVVPQTQPASPVQTTQPQPQASTPVASSTPSTSNRPANQSQATSDQIVASSLPPGVAKKSDEGKPIPPGIAKKVATYRTDSSADQAATPQPAADVQQAPEAVPAPPAKHGNPHADGGNPHGPKH